MEHNKFIREVMEGKRSRLSTCSKENKGFSRAERGSTQPILKHESSHFKRESVGSIDLGNMCAGNRNTWQHAYFLLLQS